MTLNSLILLLSYLNFDFQYKTEIYNNKHIFFIKKNYFNFQPGSYITIHIKDVPQLLWNTFKATNSPVILMGMFPYEHKMSVLNVVLKRTANYDVPIKSKERLIFQCGYRRFIVNPIFSQHTNGDKHKVSEFWCFLFFYIEGVNELKVVTSGDDCIKLLRFY